MSQLSLDLSLFDSILFIIVVYNNNNWYQSLIIRWLGLAHRSSVKFSVMKFNGSGNFELWQRHVKDLLVQQGMVKALYRTKLEGMVDIDWRVTRSIELHHVEFHRRCANPNRRIIRL
jgi:hypothetical protein